MNTEIRLHGFINSEIEYFATAAGCRTAHHHFYQVGEEQLRLFSPGNELVIDRQGVFQSGNGGAFCEYMFGVDQPLADLTKEGILNRLILLGVSYDTANQLQVTDHQQSQINFSQLFFEGHAIYNNFFFVDGLAQRQVPEQQQEILFLLGKTLKRMPQLNQRDDSKLTAELLSLLPDGCTLFLIRLINSRHRQYQEEFQRLYYKHRSIPDPEFNALQEMAERLAIDRYQQERIRIDVMYRHRDNYRIIDEYKKVLTECHLQGRIDRQQHARLTRLKTLSVRNKIPAALFHSLDQQLQAEPEATTSEPAYLTTTREILEGIFLTWEDSQSGIDDRDMVQLLHAKQQAHTNRDHTFEQLLLETGKLCDEQIRDGAPLSLLENFSTIVAYFDRYDSTSTQISQLAFMENIRFGDDLLRSLLGSQQIFNELQDDLFNQLFFAEIFANNYLGRFGRRKLLCLQKGLQEIAADRATLQELNYQVRELGAEELLYTMVLQKAKERIRNRYSRYDTRSEQEALFEDLNAELSEHGIISDQLDAEMFQAVIHDIKKEAVYLHSLLPEILASQDRNLREDFLCNSGLDRFYVEELERDYFTRNDLDQDQLQQLRLSSPG